ncbi:Hypothetical predicted protein [Cloeon dipterum]|uniref:Uncharacterized protein n=1 Tax=Cloeon dipterum TaxID=197152 RepID=A0A8S1E3C6_9INSE|nr:Hypothetical predicted protein [Cloeon dipterum]
MAGAPDKLEPTPFTGPVPTPPESLWVSIPPQLEKLSQRALFGLYKALGRAVDDEEQKLAIKKGLATYAVQTLRAKRLADLDEECTKLYNTIIRGDQVKEQAILTQIKQNSKRVPKPNASPEDIDLVDPDEKATDELCLILKGLMSTSKAY